MTFMRKLETVPAIPIISISCLVAGGGGADSRASSTSVAAAADCQEVTVYVDPP